MKLSQIVKTILFCTADVHNPDREEANDDGWCEVDERPSGVTDTLLQEPQLKIRKLIAVVLVILMHHSQKLMIFYRKLILKTTLMMTLIVLMSLSLNVNQMNTN